MKYIVFASMLSLLSMNSFALGQNSATDIDCCKTGKCGNGLPQCPLKRTGEKREYTAKPNQNSKGKAGFTIGQ